MPAITLFEPTRRLLKHAKHFSNEERPSRALELLALARANVVDHGDKTDAAPLLPHIRHRQAMALKDSGETDMATRMFMLAIELFNASGDYLGEAITRRDYGMMLYDAGYGIAGVQLIESALDMLGCYGTSEREQREWIVTRAFLAQTYAYPRVESIDICMDARTHLAHGTKLVYELDNERALVPMLTGRDQLLCRARASALYRLIVFKNHCETVPGLVAQGRPIEAVSDGLMAAFHMIPHALRQGD